jgi:hypothetical protein
MRNCFLTVAVAAGVVAALAGTVPAAVAGQATPRTGKFVGQEEFGNNPLAVSFTVPKNRQRVLDFSGQAEAKDGCTNHITGFSAPDRPMTITADGHFSAVSRNYPKGVRVKVTGTFTSRAKARGHISVRIAKLDGCNASRLFTAVRTGPPTQ